MSLLWSVECGCVSSESVKGVRPSCVSEEVLVTRESGKVQLLKLAGGGVCVRSWQINNITSPAVQHPLTNHYWAVVNDNELFSWTTDETSHPHSTYKLHTPVHTLLVTNSNDAPLVVHSNGILCVAREKIKTLKDKQQFDVVFAAVLECSDRVCVVCACKGVLCVKVWAVDCEGVSVVTSATLDNIAVSSFCTSQNKLLATGGDGCVHSWTLTPEIKQYKSVSVTDRPIRLQISALFSYFVTFSGNCLLLWEPVYMTKQAEINVSGVNMVYSCGEWVCGVGEAVRVWRVTSTGPGLVGALNKNNSPPSVTMMTWGCVESEECDSDSIDKLSNAHQTPTLEAFLATFATCTLSSDLCYSRVVERLLREGVFWASEVLIQLLRAGLVSQSLADQLLCAAMAHRDWELMSVCLELLSSYSEDIIMDTVKQLLSVEETGLLHSQRDTLLCMLLCQPFNDALLQQPLSQLSPSAVRKLVGFITSQLTLPSLLSQAPPTYNALLDWAGQLLDVHFTQLTFDPDVRDVLVLLQRTIRDQVTCYNRLACVRGALDAITQLTTHTSAPNGWLYRVETVDIDL